MENQQKKINYPIAACTGMSMKAKDETLVVARTIDWGGSEVQNYYTIVPRDYKQQSLLPNNATDGAKFSAIYGFVGMAMGEKEFVVEGLNEVGLSAGLFYFPDYGEYPQYDLNRKEKTVADFQLVSLLLSSFATVDEVINHIQKIDVVSIYPGASTVHWRIADQKGRQVVLEYVKGKPHFYENTVGVITNSPGFEWQLINLNNYLQVTIGTHGPRMLGSQSLKSIGSGSGYLGLPGDFTPPSRFVRAAYLLNTTREQPNGLRAILQLFHLLNTFDVPVACDTPMGQEPEDFPSATQWTIATNITQKIIYYHTMYNRNIRCIDFKEIDFTKVPFTVQPLDVTKEQPIEKIEIKY